MKLKNVQAYPIDGVPEHLTQECVLAACELIDLIMPLMEKYSENPNILLGGITFMYASIIKNLISDDIEQQKKAANLAAIAIIKNVASLNDYEWESEMK